jgi:hypothetical protein
VVLRHILMTFWFALAWLAAAFSQLETVATGTASGPVCRFAAWCAASSFQVGAYFGGDDGLIQFLRSDLHLQDCVRTAASPPDGRTDPSIRFLAHVLFDYRSANPRFTVDV